MNNLHFIRNNIFTKFFKELIKSKNDYQQYLNYIYIYKLYYASKLDFVAQNQTSIQILKAWICVKTQELVQTSN